MTTYTLKACPIATLPVPGWECFFGKNDTTMHDLTFYVWIVRGGGKIGLIDTGLPLNPADLAALDAANQKVDAQCVYSRITLLPDLLRRENLTPQQIDFVVITQPITYHTGGLVAELLPRAQVWMSRAGMLEFLLDNVGHPPRSFYFTETSWAFLRKLLIEDRLHLIDEETEVLPGIVFETTGGHHPGSAGIRIQTARGVVGILETAFLQANIENTHPIGVAEDAAACRRAIKKYKRLCDFVAADHEPSLALRFAEH
jgi:glyoxylase-like metal-dependent hydrolase (beta-lactamase superfamily II)